MDTVTLDIIQCLALIIVPYLTFRQGRADGFYKGSLATLNYLEDQGIVKFEEVQKEINE